MALNNSHAQGGVLIFAGERILIYYDGVEVSFEGPSDVVPMKGKKKGTCFLTTHRVIFNSKDPKDSMQSFSFPFLLMRGVELAQPVFGANYIKGSIKAEPYGNWVGEAKWKMSFSSGGAIEFGQAMVTAGKLASRNRPVDPPAYSPPPASGYYNAPPPAYQPPGTDYYSWVPYSTFPNAPPANSVYTHDAPPPYPGIGPNTMAYNTPTAPMNGHDAKAQEASASAYYDPVNQHNFYAPATQSMVPPAYSYPSAPPPSYDDAQKKSN